MSMFKQVTFFAWFRLVLVEMECPYIDAHKLPRAPRAPNSRSGSKWNLVFFSNNYKDIEIFKNPDYFISDFLKADVLKHTKSFVFCEKSTEK